MNNNGNNKFDQCIHSGHRDRMRDKYIVNGYSGLPEHELLEMILFCSIPRKNTNDIAHRLIYRFGSLQGVLNASAKELQKVEGVGKNTAVFLKNFKNVVEAYNNRDVTPVKINGADDCGRFLLDRYGDTTQEIVSVLCLDDMCNVLEWRVLCEGSIQSASFNIKNLISTVVGCDAVSIVLAHNHPYGVALPSKDDIASTVILREALKHVNVALLDHIIIAGDDYISMADSSVYKHIFTD